MRIRNATASDASGIASILHEAFVEYRPLYTREGYSVTTPGPGEIRVRMEQGPLWVAVFQGRMVGTASAVAKPEGLYIRGMAVIPAARTLGVGRLLLQHVESFAATSGCHRLFLSTTPFLDRAIRLYEGFGFRRTNDGPHDLFGTPLFTMEKMLPSTGDRDDPGQGIRELRMPQQKHVE